ncbi:DUF3617 family protein [Xenophilus sp. Marseille-Q4582]|uniref:DUF3617 domain-containing protein n=1 Tax=Xenophilus sp. Marseille-Q4582 TaxID=2866600 RepID=UPI001CE48FE5|nr:DUF3617 family protein [Xenophilus sp. Marseille-Q4582]
MSLSFPLLVRAGLAAALGAAGAAVLAGPGFPPRKPGLWEMRSVQKAGAKEAMTVQQCADSATDKALQEYGLAQPQMNRKFCKEEMRNEAGKMLVHTETCRQSGTTMTRRIVISGDFNVAYRVESHTVYDPKPRTPPPDEDLVADMRWLGACPAGMKPGDMMLPGGMKVNVQDMTRMGALAGQLMRTGPDAKAGEMTLPDGTQVDLEAMKRMAAEMHKQMGPAARGAGNTGK